jgi:hypothetical protein
MFASLMPPANRVESRCARVAVCASRSVCVCGGFKCPTACLYQGQAGRSRVGATAQYLSIRIHTCITLCSTMQWPDHTYFLELPTAPHTTASQNLLEGIEAATSLQLASNRCGNDVVLLRHIDLCVEQPLPRLCHPAPLPAEPARPHHHALVGRPAAFPPPNLCS